MKKLNSEKLAQLHTSSEHFDEKYGPTGSPERKAFEAQWNSVLFGQEIGKNPSDCFPSSFKFNRKT